MSDQTNCFPKSKSDTIAFYFFNRVTTVLFVSAFWHGVHPGYYLTFMSVPMVVSAEARMSKAIKPYLSRRLEYGYDWISWFFLYRAFEYLGVGFMMLQLGSIWKVWTRMYFIGHIVILLFMIIPSVIPVKRLPKIEDDINESKKFSDKSKSS